MTEPIAPDSKTDLEQRDYAAQSHQEHLANFRADRKQRKKFGRLVFRLMVGWLIGIGILLLLTGFGTPRNTFLLSDKVLISLVAGVSVNVIGTFAIVMNYLFRKAGGIGSGGGDTPKKVVARARGPKAVEPLDVNKVKL